jgi:DNA-binding MarR family transcriptional regulator
MLQKREREDRRYSNIALTGSGEKIVAKINETFNTAFSPVFENIPLSEHGHILSALETITVILKQMRNQKCCEED